MATTRRDRHPFAQMAVDSFLAQQWPHLQVVVYNGTSVPFKRNRRVRDIQLRAMAQHDMLNLALHNSDGKYCVLLYDDCAYEPEFVQALMRDISADKLHLLQFKEAYSLTDKVTRLVDDDRMFCPAWRRLHPVRFTSDPADFTSKFYNLKRVEARAGLVTRFVL